MWELGRTRAIYLSHHFYDLNKSQTINNQQQLKQPLLFYNYQHYLRLLFYFFIRGASTGRSAIYRFIFLVV